MSGVLRPENLGGRRFGQLVATALAPKKPGEKTRWWCACDCGERVSVPAGNLKSGKTRSCGCRQRRSEANDVASFWGKVDKHGPVPAHVPDLGPCWSWLGKRTKGYGRHSFKQRVTLAHRFSWVLAKGALTDADCVLHKCDNPGCVNPEHLFIGDRGDNARDMAAKGRQHLQRNPKRLAGSEHWTRKRPDLVRVGSARHTAKLTESQVLAMREEYARGGITVAALAAANGLSKTSTATLLAGDTWKHVGGPLKVRRHDRTGS